MLNIVEQFIGILAFIIQKGISEFQCFDRISFIRKTDVLHACDAVNFRSRAHIVIVRARCYVCGHCLINSNRLCVCVCVLTRMFHGCWCVDSDGDDDDANDCMQTIPTHNTNSMPYPYYVYTHTLYIMCRLFDVENHIIFSICILVYHLVWLLVQAHASYARKPILLDEFFSM